jgi:hypothetical protein
VNYKFGHGTTLKAGARWNHDKKTPDRERAVRRPPLFVGGGPVPRRRPRSTTAS